MEHAPQRRRPAPLGEPGLDSLSIRDHLFHLTVTSFDDVRRLSTVENLDATARSVRVQLGHEPLQSLILVPDKVLVGHDVRSVAGHVTRQFLIHADFAEPPGDGPQESFLLDGEFRVAAVAQMKALAVQTLPIRRVRVLQAIWKCQRAKCMAKQVSGRLARRVMDHRSILSFRETRNAVERPRLSIFESRVHTLS